ncbi:YitT family protein [Blastococcus sp. Marseille-P5729]|uniref:membrane protein YczE n=1 Tax=Blastococcus sp. Marseille-P5729 TaxID=2086582 RepID=UPI0018FE9308|nr:hypothetical protein [Blastococcus sp. Marseille-P5729]
MINAFPSMKATLPRVFLPVPADRWPRRAIQLFTGLSLFGIGMAMQVRAAFGLDPWNVLHEGLAKRTGLSFGTVLVIVGLLVIALWIPLRQRLGIGTIANAVWVGIAADLTLWVVPPSELLAIRIPEIVFGVAGVGFAGALYIGAGLGSGPRDGLMMGLHERGFGSIRLMRTLIELSVLAIGWLLGGTVGIATVLFALAIGPLVQLFLPWVAIEGLRSSVPAGPNDAPEGS